MPANSRYCCWGLLGLTMGCLVWNARAEQPVVEQTTAHTSTTAVRNAGLQRPTAAVFLSDARTLCVANARGGFLSLVDVERGLIIGRVPIGASLVDLIAVPNRSQLLAIDGQQNELVVIGVDGPQLRVQSRLAVSPGASQVVVTPDGRLASVSCHWSRCVEIVNLQGLATESPDAASAPERLHRIGLPFAPGLQCVTGDGRRAVVADRFGGGIAVIDLVAGQLLRTHELTGHNTRGITLTADGRGVILAQQILNQQLPTTAENIERGLLIQNVLRTLSLDELLAPEPGDRSIRPQAGEIIPLGGIRAGAGDPAGIVSLSGQRLVVALAGVQQVAVVAMGAAMPQVTERVAVGRRPVAIVARPGTTQVAVLNQLDDSITLLETDRGEVLRTIAAESQMLSPQDRGEQLFFDARLSRDGWLSCHSCHTDGHTNGRLADTQGDHSFGTPKRTLTLLGTAFTYRWAWNGEVASLHDQVQKSLVETMHGGENRAADVRDIVSYLHSLAPPPPLLPRTTSREDQASLERGRQIFLTHGCANCHIPPIVYASHESFDVGLTDERGLSKFNPPSLRGVGQGTRYFHDNRAESLDSVFADFQHPGSTTLSGAEIADLVRYLKSL